MVSDATNTHRRKSVAVSYGVDNAKRKRRARSTTGLEVSPFTRSRLSLGPVKSILKKLGMGSTATEEPVTTASMDMTQDYHVGISDNFTRKSMGRRVSFKDTLQVRKFEPNPNDTVSSVDTSSPQSSPTPSSDDDPPVNNDENDYPGASSHQRPTRRSSIRFSVANSDMDMTGVFDIPSSPTGEPEDQVEGTMEVTRENSNALRKQSLSNHRPSIHLADESFTDNEQSYATSSEQSESTIEYTVPLCQALKPAHKDEMWLALRNMTHAAADGQEEDGPVEEEGDSEDENGPRAFFQSGGNESMSSMDDDSFSADQTINITRQLSGQSLNDDLMRDDNSFDEPPAYKESSSPPKPNGRLPIFKAPSSTLSPSKQKPKQFTAAFAPPVNRPSPQKRIATSPTKKRPRPSEDVENIDAGRPSPAKKLAVAEKEEVRASQSTVESPRPTPLSPSKKAPFQNPTSQTSMLRRPSGYFARRKSLAVASNATTTVSRTSPKKKAGIGLGRASLGGPGSSDAWKRFGKNDDPRHGQNTAKLKDDAVAVSFNHESSGSRQDEMLATQDAGSLQPISMEGSVTSSSLPALLGVGDLVNTETTEQWREMVEPDSEADNGEQLTMSIEQFMELTAVKFMDELTVPRRSMHPLQIAARQTREAASNPFSAYAIAIGLDAPTFVLYTRVSEDLQAWMQKSRADFLQAEEEAAKATPELFVEYSRTDEDGQADLLHQLKLIRTNSRELAKSDWYDWKLKWIEGLTLTAQRTFEDLTADAKLLENVNVQAPQVLPQLESQYRETIEELEREEKEIAALADLDEDYLGELKASIAEQSLEVERLRSELTENNEQIKWLHERLTELEMEKQMATEVIGKAEHELNVHRNSTSTEVFRLKDELEGLEDLHMFQICKVHAELFEFVYASTVRVLIPCHNFLPVPNQVQLSKLDSAKQKYKDDFPKLSRYLLADAQRRIRESNDCSIRKIARTLADYWSSCSQVRFQLRHLAIRYPVEIEVAKSGFVAKASVLFPKQQAKVDVCFEFDQEIFSHWPVTVQSIQCKTQVLYGSMEPAAILSAVKNRLAQASLGEHYGCLLDACIEAQESMA